LWEKGEKRQKHKKWARAEQNSLPDFLEGQGFTSHQWDGQKVRRRRDQAVNRYWHSGESLCLGFQVYDGHQPHKGEITKKIK